MYIFYNQNGRKNKKALFPMGKTDKGQENKLDIKIALL